MPRFRCCLAAVVVVLACAGPAQAATFVVTLTTDPDNTTGSCAAAGSCSLRQAVNAANSTTAADTITFAGGVTTVHVTNGPTSAGIQSTHPVTIDGGGTVTISADSGNNTLVVDNAAATAATTTIKNITIDGKGTFVTVNGGGGILMNASGGGAHTLTLDHATVKGFTSSSGGAGLEAAGALDTVNVIDSTIANNTASAGSTGGGGIYVSDGHLNVIRSTLSGNAATNGLGGAINAAFGGAGTEVATIVDSTISGNSAGQGPAIEDTTGHLKISFTTITGNTASGAGAGAVEPGGYTTDRFKGVIMNNPGSPKECSNISQGTVDGFNFFRDATCQTSTSNSNHPSSAVSVGALQDNGGPTFTQALPSGSAAINSVPNANCTDISAAALSLDQRSVARPQDGACDAGAYEFVPPPANSVAPSISGTATVGSTLTCSPGTWSSSPTFTYEWRRDGSAIGGATGTTYNVASADAGHSLVCHVTATNSSGSTSADSSAVAIPVPDTGGTGGTGGTTGGTGGTTGGTGGTTGGGGTAADTTAPVLSAFTVAPATFRTRTTVRYTLSEAAKVTFVVQRVRHGKRSVVARFARSSAAGAHSFRLGRKIAGHRLPAGRYRLVGQARDAAGNASAKLARAFRIR